MPFRAVITHTWHVLFGVITRYDIIKDYFEQYYISIQYHTPFRVNKDLQCYWFLSEMKTRIKIP